MSPHSRSAEDDPRPQPPVPPEDDECCHSGCTPCVYDLYDEALDRYRDALAAWEARKAERRARNEPRRQGANAACVVRRATRRADCISALPPP